MGGSARYRYNKKVSSLQQKYGPDYSNNPDYFDELGKAIDIYLEQKQREKERKTEQETDKDDNNSPYSDNYSQERLDRAMWTDDKQEVDDAFRQSSGDWWRGITEKQQEAAAYFTGGSYDDMNRLLGGLLGVTDYGYDDALEKVNELTDALEQSSIPQDIWVRRGVSNRHIARLLGVENPDISEDYDTFRKQIQDAVNGGEIMSIANFMSTGATPNSGFGNSVEMKIFVPKGSKGIYAEPFSSHGAGAGGDWDGKSPQRGFSSEFEIILQRGYRLKPIAYNPKQGKHNRDQIVFMIVGREELKPVERPEIKW